jgi:AbrB family looped-hinge helix DNA binding protein
MRITSKGQVTVPIEIRRRLGFLPETEVDFVVEGNAVRLLKKRTARCSRGQRVLKHLRGKGNVQMTTDEILALTRGDE